MLTIPASTLRAAFAPLSKLIGRPTLPVLAHLRVERVNGIITFTGTDLDRWLTFSHPLERPALTPLARKLAELRWKREAVCFLVPLGAVKDALTAVKGDSPVTLEKDAIGYDLAGSPVRVPFKEIAVAEYPSPLACQPLAAAVPIPTADRDALLLAETFTSADEHRYILQGALIEHRQEKDAPAETSIVATDGRRLFLHRANFTPGASAVVPNMALTLLGMAGLCAHPWTVQAFRNDECRMTNDEGETADNPQSAIRNPQCSMLHFTAGPWALATKTIEGNFPNYRQVIPTGEMADAVLPPDAHARLCTILKQLPPSKKDQPSIALGYRITDGTLVVRDTESGIVALVPGVPGIQGGLPVFAAFARNFLAEMLTLGPGTIRLRDAMSAMLYDAANGARHVLMPMRGDAIAPHMQPLIPDPDREALEAVFLGKTVIGIEKNEEGYGETGTVEEVVREFREVVALVTWEGRKVSHRAPFKALRLHEPAAATEAPAPAEETTKDTKPKARKPAKKRELAAA